MIKLLNRLPNIGPVEMDELTVYSTVHKFSGMSVIHHRHAWNRVIQMHMNDLGMFLVSIHIQWSIWSQLQKKGKE